MKAKEEPQSTAATNRTRWRRHLPHDICDGAVRNLVLYGGVVAALAAVIYTTLAQAPQPVLSISPLGSNQFAISITDTVTTNYTLEWTSALANTNYPWQPLWEVSGTNTTVDASASGPVGWFRVMVGIDGDGDGIPPWLDANDNDANVGILTVIIDSPLNGAVLE